MIGGEEKLLGSQLIFSEVINRLYVRFSLTQVKS